MYEKTKEMITGYDYKTILEAVYEDVVDKNGLKLGKVYKGIDVYVQHNKIDSTSYKVFINDIDKYNSILYELKRSTDDPKKVSDKLAQDLLNNFDWEVIVDEN